MCPLCRVARPLSVGHPGGDSVDEIPFGGQIEALTHEGDDDFSGSQRMEATVVDSHGLDSNRNVRPILGDLFNFDGIPRAFR